MLEFRLSDLEERQSTVMKAVLFIRIFRILQYTLTVKQAKRLLPFLIFALKFAPFCIKLDGPVYPPAHSEITCDVSKVEKVCHGEL